MLQVGWYRYQEGFRHVDGRRTAYMRRGYQDTPKWELLNPWYPMIIILMFLLAFYAYKYYHCIIIIMRGVIHVASSLRAPGPSRSRSSLFDRDKGPVGPAGDGSVPCEDRIVSKTSALPALPWQCLGPWQQLHHHGSDLRFQLPFMVLTYFRGVHWGWQTWHETGSFKICKPIFCSACTELTLDASVFLHHDPGLVAVVFLPGWELGIPYFGESRKSFFRLVKLQKVQYCMSVPVVIQFGLNKSQPLFLKFTLFLVKSHVLLAWRIFLIHRCSLPDQAYKWIPTVSGDLTTLNPIPLRGLPFFLV